MAWVLWIAGVAVAGALAGLALWRACDHLAERREWRRLAALQPHDPPRFDPAVLEGLPEPVQRFFRFAIHPGTPLAPVACIQMEGRFGMGDRDRPKYMAMRARQILAAPEGFLWKMRARRGWMVLSGSDSASWTRFWLAGLVPVARLGGSRDHARSAFGRYIAEAVFWSPAALLPARGITWQARGENGARVTVGHGALRQSIDLELDRRGAPVCVHFMRWSDANRDRTFRLQPFGGYLSGFRDFGGFTLPTRVEAGNHFATQDYFPFFVIDVTGISFPARDGGRGA